MTQETIDRIEKDAAKLYQYRYSDPNEPYSQSITIHNSVQSSKIVAYISGAKAEATRAEGLVEALEAVVRSIEGDYMVDGKWVDDPCILVQTIHRVTKAALEKYRG